MKQTFFLPFFLCVILQLTGCITPNDFTALENRVTSLEMDHARQLERRKASQKNAAAELAQIENECKTSQETLSEKYADLKSEMDKLKADIRFLSGKIEESEHELAGYNQSVYDEGKKKLERIDKIVSKNYQRIKQLESYMGFEPSDDFPMDRGESTKEVESEESVYKHAKSLLDDDKTESARREFEKFLSLFPDSDKVDNAKFWIAESYYRDKWYEKAILEYQAVIENYPQGNKVAASLLKQGYAFDNLGETANARLILKELVKKFPESNEAKIARKKLKNP
ncbi:MAG: tol-pal system protein YbgF [Desulfobacteraceae bacterium]